jgi:hypothetical protein
MTKKTELLSIPFKTFTTDKKTCGQQQCGGLSFQCSKGHVHVKGRSPDTGAAGLSHGDRLTPGESKGHLDLHPDSETLQYLKATIILALKETKRLIEGFGKLPRVELSCFRYWFAVQEAHDIEALLEVDEDEDEDGKEKGNTVAAADDPDVVYVEAAATNHPDVVHV